MEEPPQFIDFSENKELSMLQTEPDQDIERIEEVEEEEKSPLLGNTEEDETIEAQDYKYIPSHPVLGDMEEPRRPFSAVISPNSMGDRRVRPMTGKPMRVTNYQRVMQQKQMN